MTDTHTATVRVDHLRRLLADALCTADDDTLPMLCGVVLYTAPKGTDTVLVATSTDRFILGQGHISTTGALPQIMVPTPEVKRAAAVLEYELGDRFAELSIADGYLRVTTATMHVEFAIKESNQLPKWAHSLAALFDTSNSACERHVFIAADKLARIVEVASRRDDRAGQALRIELYGAHRAVHIHVSGDYRAMVMPVKAEGGRFDSQVPLFLPPSEQADAVARDGGDQ